MPAAEAHDSYDEVPYQSGPFRQTRPCHLAVLPHLFGLEPPPTRAPRVLELGCASGGNLIPMADQLPEGEFLGIDLSARQIAAGANLIEALGSKNVELRHASILEVDDDWGKFDYIVCHGVYSWVPREVQDKILAIGARNLQRHGLLYVSYNTYPGWHLRGVVRDMMQYHVAPFRDAQSQIDQARSLLEFLNKSTTPRSATYRQLLADESQILARHDDSYLFHEHLEEVNDPVYFHEFTERVARAGLAYLGDSDFSSMLADNFDAETAAILSDAPLLRQEQYMDFLRNRMFRASVLCHADVAIDRGVPSTRLARCELTLVEKLPLDAKLAARGETNVGEVQPDLAPLQVRLGDETITASQPITKAALRILNAAWPASCPFEELLAESLHSSQQAGDAPELRKLLATDLMTMFSRSLITASIDPPKFTLAPGDYPQATPHIRLQAQRGSVVTTRRHESLRLSDLSRALLVHLDGQHSRKELLDWLGGAIGRGEFKVSREEKPLAKIDAATLSEILAATLQSLASSALLIA